MMKKIVKPLLIALFLVLIVLLLTGCGKNKKMVAVCSNKELLSKLDEKIKELTIEKGFKNKKLYEIDTYTFENKDEAKEFYAARYGNLTQEEKDAIGNVKLTGKKVIVEINMRTYFRNNSMITLMGKTKEEVEKLLDEVVNKEYTDGEIETAIELFKEQAEEENFKVK